MSWLPVPAPEVVRAARSHLTSRYATGVERMLWEVHRQPLSDQSAIRAVVAVGSSTTEEDPRLDPKDLAAALVVMEALQLDIDKLEAELLDAVKNAGMTWESIAAILNLPDPREARDRFGWLRERWSAPTDEVAPPSLEEDE